MIISNVHALFQIMILAGEVKLWDDLVFMGSGASAGLRY